MEDPRSRPETTDTAAAGDPPIDPGGPTTGHPVLAGGRLGFDEALRVYDETDTEALRRSAVAIRDRFAAPGRVTYLVDRNVNYTNVCNTDCKFCEFYRPPGHAESYVLDRAVLEKKLSELVAVGGTRVLLQGGHHPELGIAWYEDLLRWMSASFPTIEIDGLSPPEVEHVAKVSQLSLEETVDRLKSAGLDGIPGGGGEILDDEIRNRVSPKKTDTKTWLRVMEIAHERDLYTSASQVIGFGEETIHRVRSLDNLRRQQDRSLERFGRGFMAFISWPLQFESRYGHVFGGIKGIPLGASEAQYLRHTAFARVYLDNIPHFQASWPTMGLPCAREALRFGCDDMGGTMMEENVVSQAGSVHCSVSELEVRRTIEEAGFAPQKRDSRYHPLPSSDPSGIGAPEAPTPSAGT